MGHMTEEQKRKQRERRKRYRETRGDEINAKQRAYRKAHADKIREYDRARKRKAYWANKTAVLAAQKARRERLKAEKAMGHEEKYIAEEIAKYGPIQVEGPDTREPAEIDRMRQAIFRALGWTELIREDK